MADDFYQEYGPIKRRRQGSQEPTAHQAVRDLPYDEPAHAPRRPGAQPRRNRLRALLWGMGLTLLLVGLSAGGGLWYLTKTFDGRIYPNVAIQGVDVSQMSREQAKTALLERFDQLLKHPTTLSFNGRTWEPSLAEIGGALDIDGAIEQAFNVGRDENVFASARQVAATWRDGYDIPLRLTLDESKLQAYLSGNTADLIVAPVDANLVIGEASAAITPAREGRVVLVDETALEIGQHLRNLEAQPVTIRTRIVPPLMDDASVAESKRTVDAILQTPLTLTAGANHEWTLSQSDLRALIQLRRERDVNGKTVLRAGLDKITIRQRVATFADEIGRGSVNPRVAWNGGELTIIREGRKGLRLDEDASATKITDLATSGISRTIELVVNEIDPDVTPENLGNLGIVEAVGVGKSSFVGSAAYRIQNIKAGSRLLDGILIKPGEEFSFNENVGSIDEANGFAKGYAIINNRTQEEWGGGICQDSTTLFRAAFYAGLPITERHEHSFRISWYEVYAPYGMDAAIFTGVNDFRFLNDTGNWLLLNTYVDDATTTVTYVLYGTKPDREVLLDGPYVEKQYPKPTEPVYVADAKEPVGTFHQTDTSRDGMDITVYRVIKQGGRVISREPFYTHFKPWPDIFAHNPATKPPPKGCYPNRPCAALAPPPPVQPAPEQPQPPAPEQPQPPAPEQPQPTPTP
ncbi:MAG TPA: VanW family protein [Herpetosiphonaceae bacterium]